MTVHFFSKSDSAIKSYDAKREKDTTIMIELPKEKLIIASMLAMLGVPNRQSCCHGSSALPRTNFALNWQAVEAAGANFFSAL